MLVRLAATGVAAFAVAASEAAGGGGGCPDGAETCAARAGAHIWGERA